MKKLEISIPIGLGDAIYTKAQLDAVKEQFSEINISFHKDLISKYKNNSPEYSEFLDQLGQLLFSDASYIYHSNSNFPLRSVAQISSELNIYPQKPNLQSFFCKGNDLKLDRHYLVLSTKVRFLDRKIWNKVKEKFFEILNSKSSKYYFVLLGEKEVEMNTEYQIFGTDGIYSLYSDFISYLPTSSIIDKTIPALGITSPNIEQIQQDALIMSQASKVITVGIGGGFCLATAVGDVIGLRTDDDMVANYLYNHENYSNAFVTKNFNSYISKILEL